MPKGQKPYQKKEYPNSGLRGYIAKDPSPYRPTAENIGELKYARSVAYSTTRKDMEKNPGMYENAPKRAYPHSYKWATQAEAYGQRRNAGLTPLRNGKKPDTKKPAAKPAKPKPKGK